ncbi:MAG: dihydrodipicolinate synthase family protein [bacterium]|nr:dihydrodipicolinate synthase family protein [bacterium]
MSHAIEGVWSAVLTPVDADLRPDAARALAYYRSLLDDGLHGINLLGTTGEAMSFSVRDRLALMETLSRDGFPMERAMVGTGAAALEDCATLTRAAFDLGFAAALVMPPFYYRDITDDGVMRFFDALLARAHRDGGKVLLYNFPRMSGITFHARLTERLLAAFPEAIVGMKDSSNDRALQAELVGAHPSFAVMPGSEHALVEYRERGLAGCISGSVALWVALARRVFDGRDAEDGRALDALRASLDGLPMIPAVRYLVARSRRDDAWERCVPPLAPLDAERRATLDARDLVRA